jgi:hypothetical protein
MDFPAVGDPQHQDDEAVVLDRADDSLVPDSHTPATPFATSKHRGARGARLDAEELERTGDAKPLACAEFLERLCGC